MTSLSSFGRRDTAGQPTVIVMSVPWTTELIRLAAVCDELAIENLHDVFGFPSDTRSPTTRFKVETLEALT
ncbi:MAG: hypothetical protein ABI899_08785 [Actinomycetota bacterium]